MKSPISNVEERSKKPNVKESNFYAKDIDITGKENEKKDIKISKEFLPEPSMNSKMKNAVKEMIAEHQA